MHSPKPWHCESLNYEILEWKETTSTLPLAIMPIPPAWAKHLTALALLLSFGILPLVPFFITVYNPFSLNCATCNGKGVLEFKDCYYSPGIQGLFTIDRTCGSFPFWFVKLIDAIWDLFVGRGFQWLASWVSYNVFSSVLLRAMEESQIPFRTFLKLSTETPSLTSVWFLLKDMSRFSRIRLILRFSYIALASSYVIAMPTLLSTITGYISKSTSFTKLPKSGSLVYTSDIYEGITVTGNLSGIAIGTCYPDNTGFQGLSSSWFLDCQFEPLLISFCLTEKLQAKRVGIEMKARKNAPAH
ncbi:uncharacterized protein BKA78DRAFT_36768 [Phyllosticta capitalensis]|uniref:uncharacterized protein n=1 Tax=Phyllosticta capitalensis TaxID=121624 RepID=UPI00312E5AF0